MPMTTSLVGNEHHTCTPFLRFFHHSDNLSSTPLPWIGVGDAEGGRVMMIADGSGRWCKRLGDVQELMPAQLAVQDRLSSVASFMRFHFFTGSSTVTISIGHVQEAWAASLQFVSDSVCSWDGGCSLLAKTHRCVLVGAYVERISSAHFQLGLVLQSHDSDEIRDAIERWHTLLTNQHIAFLTSASYCNNQQTTNYQLKVGHLSLVSDLPMCADVRKLALLVRMGAAPRQITAGEILPPITVTLVAGSSPAECDVSELIHKIFSSVRIFSVRSTQTLQGGTEIHFDMPMGESGCGGTRDFTPNTCQAVGQVATGRKSLRLTFDAVFAATSGETLIGVECKPRQSLLPFMMPLSALIPCFLVI